MPYNFNSQLPKNIRENMPEEAQDTFRLIFNDAVRRYQDEGIAFATAYSALKRTGWKQNEDGKWVKKKEKGGKVGKQELSAEERTPPKKAQENAKKVLRWKDEHGDEVDAMTRTGWRRANQLADGKPLSMDIISRMAQFKRHKKNSEIAEEYKGTPWKDNGYVAWLGWGGDVGINWANRLTDKVDKSDNKFLKRDDKQRYTLGVVYEPMEIDSQGDFATAEEIEKGAWRFMAKLQGQSKLTKRKLEIVDSITKALEKDEQIRLDVTELLDTVEKGKGLNDMHVNTPLDEKLGTIVESYIAPIDFTIETPRGKEEVKKGSWLMGVIWNEDYFEKIEDGERTGYSMEGSGKRIDVNIDE